MTAEQCTFQILSHEGYGRQLGLMGAHTLTRPDASSTQKRGSASAAATESFCTSADVNPVPCTLQVTYSHEAARLVVAAPLVLLLTAPFVAHVGGLRTGTGPALWPAVTQVATGAGLSVASMLGGLVAPVAIGVARVALLGAPT